MDDQSPDQTAAEIKTTTATSSNEATVPSYRLREETDRRTKAENDATSARLALASLTAQFEEVQKNLESTTTRHQQDLSLYDVGVKDNEVREFVRTRFEKREDKEKNFGDWLTGQRENPSPILAPFLRTASTPTPTSNEAPKQVETKSAPNPNIGTGQPNNHQSRAFGEEELAVIRKKNSGRLGGDKESILAALRAEGVIK